MRRYIPVIALILTLGCSLSASEKPPFNVTLFPLKFQAGKPFTVAENLIGTLIMESTPGTKKYRNIKAEMTMDLPLFIKLAGAADRKVTKKNGEYVENAWTITESEIQRDGVAYRRYKITFNDMFPSLLGSSWYYSKLYLQPEKGSAGQKGHLYWSFNVGTDVQPEAAALIEVVPAIIHEEEPCKRFRLGLGFSSVDLSPFKELRKPMSDFWSKLAVRPETEMPMLPEPNPVYRHSLILNGNDLRPETPFGIEALRKLREQAPRDTNIKGAPTETALWYKVEDPEAIFENYLRSGIRSAVKDIPSLEVLKWDYEPTREGYDEGGRARFAAHMKLDLVPSLQEIQDKYHREWRQYRYKLNAKFIARAAKIVKEEAPGRELMLISTELHAAGDHLSRWCDVDIRLSDADPNIDVFGVMPYRAGTEFFDDINFNTRTLKKPLFLYQDPSERLWTYFKVYSPARLKQNIVAAAALGAVGIGLWPEDSMVAEYYRAVSEAYAVIARHEDAFFDGRRVDAEFSITPKNVFSRNYPGGMLYFPDFSSKLRMCVSEYCGTLVYSIFNYNESDDVIVEIAGRGQKFLSKIPAAGVAVIRSENLPAQAELMAELTRFHENSQVASQMQDLVQGNCSIQWGAGADRSPVLFLANPAFRIGIDALKKCELTMLSVNGKELFSGGSNGSIVFSDKDQQELQFQMLSKEIVNGVPKVVFEAVVPGYGSAVPVENPLLGLKVRREFKVEKDTVRVTISFENPTARAMNFAFRAKNHPLFGQKTLQTDIGEAKITSASPENMVFTRDAAPVPLINAAPAKWTGEAIVTTAADGTSQNILTITPDAKFTGIYIWNSRTAPSRSLELISPQITLKPGESASFEYTLN